MHENTNIKYTIFLQIVGRNNIKDYIPLIILSFTFVQLAVFKHLQRIRETTYVFTPITLVSLTPLFYSGHDVTVHPQR